MTKLLKVISILMIVFAIIALIVEVIACIGLGVIASFSILDAAASAAGVMDMGTVIGGMVFGIIGAVAMLIAGIFGSKALKTGNYKPCFILGIIVGVFAIISIIMTAVGGSFQWTALIELILPVLYILPVLKLRNE